MAKRAFRSTRDKPADDTPRSIILDGKSYAENEYTSWRCYKNVLSSKVLVEVGRLTANDQTMNGFILFDGGNTGQLVNYKRAGLNQRWDWNKSDGKYLYSFEIEPENNGFYYDFSGSKKDSTQEAKATYKCKK